MVLVATEARTKKKILLSLWILSSTFTRAQDSNATTAFKLQLPPPPYCQPTTNSSFGEGFFCEITDIGLGILDAQLAPCEVVRFTGFSPGGEVSFYLFPDSTQAGKWTDYSSLTPKSAGADVLDGCTKTTLCTIQYKPTNKSGAVYFQSQLESSTTPASRNITVTIGTVFRRW